MGYFNQSIDMQVALYRATNWDLEPTWSKSIAKSAISVTLRKKHDVFGASHVSLKLQAALVAAGGSVEELAAKQTYSQQRGYIDKFDLGEKYIIEHSIPVVTIINDLIATGKSIDEVEETPLVFVLKSEDTVLNSLGYRTSRPNGWEVAYSDAGILVTPIQ